MEISKFFVGGGENLCFGGLVMVGDPSLEERGGAFSKL